MTIGEQETMTIKAIRYVTLRNWEELSLAGDRKIEPRSFMGDDGPYTFAYSEEGEQKAREYRGNGDHSYLELFIKSRISRSGQNPIVRLEFELEDYELDEVVVYDRSHVETHRIREYYKRRSRRLTDEKNLKASRDPIFLRRAKNRYRGSKVSLAEYDGSYGIPELCIPFDIPATRLKPTEMQWYDHEGMVRNEVMNQ